MPGSDKQTPATAAGDALRSSRSPQHRRRAMRTMRKVPEVTVYFWIAKVLTTAVGEVTSDYLVHRFDPIIAVGFAGVALAASLLVQFAARRYVPWIYWLAVVMVAIFGTMAADVLHIKFGVSYLVSTVFFGLVMAACFAVWYASEKTLSIHSIDTRRRELFYWTTIMTAFALGTAAGDMTATTMHLGYFSSGLLFAALIAIPALAYWLFPLNAILAFWVAYVLTRPLGASFADWMAKAANLGGLGYGDAKVSAGLTVLIVAVVGYLSVSHTDAAAEPTPVPAR